MYARSLTARTLERNQYPVSYNDTEGQQRTEMLNAAVSTTAEDMKS